jgi:lipopolysaccharide heptosyltransferase II
MDVAFQRKVDRIVGVPICWVLSLLSFLDRDEASRTQKILIILLSEMGALVLARPMLERLKEKYPEAELHALVFRQNKEVLDLLDIVPESNILTLRNDALAHLLSDGLRSLRHLRKIGIDTVIDCELFSRISSILSYLSGAKKRVGFHAHTQEGLYRGRFINRPVSYNPYQHMARQFISMAEAIDSGGRPRVKRSVADDKIHIPPLATETDEIAAMLARFKDDFPSVIGKSLVLIYPGGGLLPIRAWPLENYCTVASELARAGYAIGVIGLKEDGPLAHEIRSHCGQNDCIDLTGYTKTVRELMLVFHVASLLITNDGGPVHFASMTPIPSIVFYGPETPVLYGPLDDKSSVYYTSLSCSPCLTAYNHRNSPCDGDNVCLKSIPPETIAEKARDILSSRESIVIQ